MNSLRHQGFRAGGILATVLATACTVPNPAFDLNDDRRGDADPIGDADSTGDAGSGTVTADAGHVDPATDAMVSVGSDASVTRPMLPDCQSDPTLFLCLRFESMVINESSSGPAVNAENAVRFEAGPDKNALRMSSAVDLVLPENKFLDSAEVTISIWFAMSQLPVNGQRVGLMDNDLEYGMFVYPSGRVRCIHEQGVAEADALIRANVWSSIACVITRNGVSLWHNGRSVAQIATSAPFTNRGGTGLVVGRDNPPGAHLSGLVDNVRMWSRALTSAEVCANAFGCTSP